MESMFVKTTPIMAARAQLWEGTNSEKKRVMVIISRLLQVYTCALITLKY